MMGEMKMLKLTSQLSFHSIYKQLGNRIGEILNKNNINASQFIPQKVNIVHAIPGRLRLQCNQWKNDKVSHSLELNFREHSLVDRVSVSSITGTLLLELKIKYLTKVQFNQLVQLAVDASSPHKEANYIETLKETVSKKGRSLLIKLSK
jgi:hypothetical protein